MTDGEPIKEGELCFLSAASGYTTTCKKALCAIWMKEMTRCALLDIAYSLDRIQEKGRGAQG